MAKIKKTLRLITRVQGRDAERKKCIDVEYSELAKSKKARKDVIKEPPLRQLNSTQDESINKGGTDNRGRHTDKKSNDHQSKIQKVEDDARQVYFEHLLHPEPLLKWLGQPAPGLENPGNLCYINTTVQILYGMKCTRQLFSSGSFWQGLDLTTVPQFDRFGQKGGFIAVALHTLFQKMHLQKCHHTVVSFKDVLVSYESFKCFDNNRQHDANELFTNLLDTLSHALTLDKGGDPISEVFRSRVISFIRCKTCGTETTNEGDTSISLEVPITGDTIGSCLSSYFLIEELHDWKCEHCEEYRPASKWFRLEQRNILIISLKRYSLTGPKNNARVSFPLDDLDMSQFMVDEHKTIPSAKFALVAVIQHYGTSRLKGHYDVIMRAGDKMWYRFNDEDVALADASELVTDDVYTIIYCRHDKLDQLIF